MRKTVLGLAIGALALAMSADAGACSRSPYNFARDPIIADYVRSAAFIDLARVQSASPILPGAYEPDLYRFESYRYVFTVVETLYGNGPATFSYIASDPIPAARPPECEGLDTLEEVRGLPRCEHHFSSQAVFERITVEAQNGRRDWPEFFHISSYHTNGQGGVRPLVIQDGTSCTVAESYIEGATYLVFRDENGSVMNSHGLNLQLISQHDDALVQAVEYFLANPTENRLPAISPQEVFSHMPTVGIFSPEECSENSDYLPPMFYGIDQISGEEAAFFISRNNEITCQIGDIYVGFGAYDESSYFYAVAVENGMVDLSGIPSQFRIEPIEVPLEDVILRLSEEAETP